MTQFSKFRCAALGVGFATFAVLAAVAQTGGAQAATGLSQCSGPSRQKVIDCCNGYVAEHPQMWMTTSHKSCREVVSCRRAKKSLTAVALVRICSVNRPELEMHGKEPESRSQQSDIRLKTDFYRVGTTVLGLPLYRFQYRNRPGVYLGVMAQDVLKVEPLAVSIGADGYYMVDYGKLGIAMERVK